RSKRLCSSLRRKHPAHSLESVRRPTVQPRAVRHRRLRLRPVLPPTLQASPLLCQPIRENQLLLPHSRDCSKPIQPRRARRLRMPQLIAVPVKHCRLSCAPRSFHTKVNTLWVDRVNPFSRRLSPRLDRVTGFTTQLPEVVVFRRRNSKAPPAPRLL